MVLNLRLKNTGLRVSRSLLGLHGAKIGLFFRTIGENIEMKVREKVLKAVYFPLGIL
jgi:hypothetical protein